MQRIVDRLTNEHRLSADELLMLISNYDNSILDYIRARASMVAKDHFGKNIYVRGLIEISSYCRNNCYYCGLRRDNQSAERYRLTDEEVLNCCQMGYNAGLRTFVLQGGEDCSLTDGRLVPLIEQIHLSYPDAAITLSLGERSKDSFQRLYNAGATRYLLRHEAADKCLYETLHPKEMSWENRIKCIVDLKDIGFQTGMGMMIGVPGQTFGSLVEDILLMEQMRPQMIGIGPYVPHSKTPLGAYDAGSVSLSLLMLAILRLMFPNALIPVTTALATLSSDGHRLGILSGANVIMPNLTPINVREKYAIYDNKASSGNEAVEGLSMLEQELSTIGYNIDFSRGDCFEGIKI